MARQEALSELSRLMDDIKALDDANNKPWVILHPSIMKDVNWFKKTKKYRRWLGRQIRKGRS